MAGLQKKFNVCRNYRFVNISIMGMITDHKGVNILHVIVNRQSILISKMALRLDLASTRYRLIIVGLG